MSRLVGLRLAAAAGMVLITVVAVLCFGATAAEADIAGEPLGSLVPARTGEALGPAAVAGDTVFVGAEATSLHVQQQGAVFVYGKPAAGWSGTQREVAVLTASDAAEADRLGRWVTTDGADVVAGSPRGELYVFAPPSGGWSGEVHEAAELTADDGAALGAPVVSGDLVLASGSDPATGDSAVYVFTEPASGWAGRLHEAAKLTPSVQSSAGSFGASVAASGSTIVVGAPGAKVGAAFPGAVYVFSEPSGGWSGELHEAGELLASDITPAPSARATFGAQVAISGDAVVALHPSDSSLDGAAYVFTEPAGGWHSAIQTAKLTAPDGVLSPGATTPDVRAHALQISGDTIVVSGGQRSPSTGLVGGGQALFVYVKPGTGWRGTLTESAKLIRSDGGAVWPATIVGQSVIAGDVRGVSEQTVITAGPAYVFVEPAAGWSGTIVERAKLDRSGSGPPAGAVDLYTQPTSGWANAGPSASLAPSGDPDGVELSDVSVAGGIAAAEGHGHAYVYDRPAGGWASAEPAATLTDAGAQLGSLAISGGTVAALAAPAPNGFNDVTDASAIDIFTPPSGGWTGVLSPAARLVASDGATFSAVAVDGGTVVATGPAAVYIFTEPAGGWSGAMHQTARLPLPANTYPRSVSSDNGRIVVNGTIDGATAASLGQGYVFTEPAGGWHDNLAPTASLAPYYFGATIPVYQEPPQGWVGTIHPAGRLLPSMAGAYPVGLAISGDTVAVAASTVGSKYEYCPCTGGIWLFAKPAAGWSGLLTAPTFTAAQSDGFRQIALAFDQGVLFAGGQPIPEASATSLDAFNLPSSLPESPVTPGRPIAQNAGISGLVTHRPRLTFKLIAGDNAPPITAVTVTPPRGLRFQPGWRLTSGVLLNGVGATSAHLTHGELAVDLRFQTQSLTLSLRWPALTTTHQLLSRINRALKHHHRMRLTFTTAADVTDATGHQTVLRLKSNVTLPRR